MNKNSIVLVVEDDPEWINIFKKLLTPAYKIETAESLNEVNILVEKDYKRFSFAIVDFRLSEDTNKFSGLNVIHKLREKNIPVIATTIYFDEYSKAVRNALVVAGAADVWFKDEINTIDVQELITSILDKSKAPSDTTQIERAFWRFLVAIVGIPVIIFLLLIGAAIIIPANLVVSLIALGIILTISLIIALALFVNKISEKNFVVLIKEAFKKIP